MFMIKSVFCYVFMFAAECTPKDAFTYAGENIIFASGSPFENVGLGKLVFLVKFFISKVFDSNLFPFLFQEMVK